MHRQQMPGQSVTGGQRHMGVVDTEGQGSPGVLMADGDGRRAMRDKFNVNVQTGGLSLSVPIPTSPGRSGFAPSLELVYNSGFAANNGIFGLGWQLSGVASISRQTSRSIPVYNDDQDTFVHSGIGELVPVLGGEAIQDKYMVQAYRPRRESDPMRIERWVETQHPDQVHWRTITSGNVTVIYGKTKESRVSQGTDDEPPPLGVEKHFSWLASEMYDGHGNHVVYEYKPEDAAGIRPEQDVSEINRSDQVRRRQVYLKAVKYGNTVPNRDLDTWRVLDQIPVGQHWMFQVVLDYGEHDEDSPSPSDKGQWSVRPDPFSIHNCGFELRTYRLCRRVLMFHHFSQELGRPSCLTSSINITYDTDNIMGATFLQSCVTTGHSPVADNDYANLSLPPMEFEYTKPPSPETLQEETFELNICELSSRKAQWVDLNGDGVPGVLAEVSGGGWYYHRNRSNDEAVQIGGPSLVAQVPTGTDSNEASFEDLTGDGLLDLVQSSSDDSLQGFFGRRGDGAWENFTPFKTYPTISTSQETWPVYKLDLTGNGRGDMLCMAPGEDGELAWYPSLGPEGYGTAQRTLGAPKFPAYDATGSIFLRDMSGDGLTDLVWVRNGSVCYWPNLGHGRFGPKVMMDNAPLQRDRETFSPRRIRMVDVTGFGGTDLIYLPPEGGAVIYYNRWGNRWSDGCRLACPPLDGYCAVDVFDIGGRGTQCLCWTSDLRGHTRDPRFIDLMGGIRPGLLRKYCNGIGGESTITYRSSVHYYLDDERSGEPWATKLPFPISCVARMSSVDLIAQTAQTVSYAYHNGYYDPIERQFRGFQMVEQWNAEDFATENPGTFQRPRILTRNWFFIGLPTLDDSAVLPGSFDLDASLQARALPNAMLTQDLTVDERREAYGALAGNARRQEIFNEDGSGNSGRPYMISQQTYQVAMCQGTNSGRFHGIFRVDGQEELLVQYERDLEELRVQHTLTLETDEYGNIRRQAIIHYGKTASTLPRDDDRQKQMETVIMYSETDYTNPVVGEPEYFHVPALSKATQYRVYPGSYLASAVVDGRYHWEKLADNNCKLLRQAIDIPIHEHPVDWVNKIPAEGCKALLSKTVTLYSNTSLSGPLPPGKLDKFSIIHQAYHLAFTTELLQQTLRDNTGSLVDPAALDLALLDGGYVKVDGETGWWAPSPRSLFKDDKGSPAIQIARQHFYIPNVEVDPFENSSCLELDKYSLLPESSVDAAGNTTTFTNSYLHLKPNLITDANGNRTEMAFDPLGRIIGTAVMGKEDEQVGDSLDGFLTAIEDKDLEEFTENPSGPIAARLLGKSGKRMIYQFSRYRISRQPGFVAELLRDKHYRDETPQNPAQIAVRITYMDGQGRSIQTAVLSENQPAPKWQMTGGMVQNQKGRPVKKFLPYFSSSHQFNRLDGSSVTMPATSILIDPLDRVVGVLNADQTWSKVQQNPWSRREFDVGDTILVEDPAEDPDIGTYFQMLPRGSYFPSWYSQRTSDGATPEQRKAAKKSEVYHNTPKASHIDALGREILSEIGDDQDKRVTRTDYDERGNISATYDACGRVVERTEYDLLGRPLHETNMDKGEAWVFPDCVAAPILSWSTGGPPNRMSYDTLRRIKTTEVKLQRDSETWVQTVKNTYGEECEQDAAKFNLRGKIHQCRDQSGIQTNHNFDFKGNCLESSVLYAKGYKEVLDWSRGDVPLEPTRHKTQSSFDAVGHTVSTMSTDCDGVKYKYDVAGRLQGIQLTHAKDMLITPLVDNIDYSEDDQVALVQYHNKSQIDHTYNDQTRRLASTRIGNTKSLLQDLSYTYDCLGKLVLKTDYAQETTYWQNTVVRPVQDFAYDALGQLLSATGREQVSASSNGRILLVPRGPFQGRSNPVPGNGKQMIQYREDYRYDLTGNILQMEHQPLGNNVYSGWKRSYLYQEPSCVDPTIPNNRLTSTQVGSTTEQYRYEGEAGSGGCMTTIPGYSNLSWDHNKRLHSFSAQVVGPSGTPETTWYVYNSRGERVRKVTERATGPNSSSTATKLKETLYLPLCDISGTYSGDGASVSRKITSMKVGALGGSHTPTVIVETTVTGNSPSEQTLVRYQMSENLELDDQGNIVSYEEYSPYGASTYQIRKTGAPRKYRFAGYHRDCESGLYVCGERYYAWWLGRWTSPDPLGTVDGLNLYAYVSNDPVNFEDHRGTWAENFWTEPAAIIAAVAVLMVTTAMFYLIPRMRDTENHPVESIAGGQQSGRRRERRKAPQKTRPQKAPQEAQQKEQQKASRPKNAAGPEDDIFSGAFVRRMNIPTSSGGGDQSRKVKIQKQDPAAPLRITSDANHVNYEEHQIVESFKVANAILNEGGKAIKFQGSEQFPHYFGFKKDQALVQALGINPDNEYVQTFPLIKNRDYTPGSPEGPDRILWRRKHDGTYEPLGAAGHETSGKYNLLYNGGYQNIQAYWKKYLGK